MEEKKEETEVEITDLDELLRKEREKEKIQDLIKVDAADQVL